MRIRINTERVREVGRRLIAEGQNLAETGRRLNSTVYTLDTWAWDGASRWRAEPLLNRVRPKSRHLGQELEALGRKLLWIANVFEQEDNTAARNLAGMPWVNFETGGYTEGEAGGDLDAFLRGVSQDAEKFGDAKDLLEILASVPLATGLVGGSTYAGQAIFFGSHGLKDFVGLSPYLTHIKDIRIPSHMAKEAFKGKFARGNVFLEGLTEVGENWEEYQGDVPKVATGIVVDTLIGVGGSAVGAAAGALVFGAVGGVLLGPGGAVVGGKIGGVLGGMAGGWVAEKVEDIGIGDRELDQAVVETVTGGIQAGVRAVDQALSPFVDSVAQLF